MTNTGNVTSLFDKVVAVCTECGGTEFELLIDLPGPEWKNIIGSCCSKCGVIVDFRVSKSDIKL